MNEQELERRFRSVTDGPQPNAPQSLRYFLHELPEARPIRQETALRRAWRALVQPASLPRLAFATGAVAVAIVVALVGTSLVMNFRATQPGATPTGRTPAPAPLPTFRAGGFVWTGNPDANALKPVAAVAGGHDGYLGVGDSPLGRGVLLTSEDALRWTEKNAQGIGTDVDLHAIAHGRTGFVAVGEVVGKGTQPEPCFFYSPDGETWTRAAVPDVLKGAPALTVAAGDGFLAAGSNPDGETYLWYSADGKTWQGGLSFVVKGEPFVMWNGKKWLLSASATSTTSPHGDKMADVFHSSFPLETWEQAYVGDPKVMVENVISGVWTEGGMKELLIARTDTPGETQPITMDESGMYIAVKTNAESPNRLQSIVLVGQTLLSIDDAGKIYTSDDWALNWQQVAFDTAHAYPSAKHLIDLGNGTYLVVGDNGLWLAKPE